MYCNSYGMSTMLTAEQFTQSWDQILFCVLSLIWTMNLLNTEINYKLGWIPKSPWFIFSLSIPSLWIVMECLYHTRWNMFVIITQDGDWVYITVTLHECHNVYRGDSTVCSTSWSGKQQRKHSSSALLTMCLWNPIVVTMNYYHKGPYFKCVCQTDS